MLIIPISLIIINLFTPVPLNIIIISIFIFPLSIIVISISHLLCLIFWDYLNTKNNRGT